MSHFPPFPPSQSGRYSPNRAYGDRPPYPPQQVPPPREYMPYPPYPPAVPPPPPSSYRPYDNYPPYPYEQPRAPYEDHYDPYQPAAKAYNAPAPPVRMPPNPYPPPHITAPPPRPVRGPSPPPPVRRPPPHHQDLKPTFGPGDLSVMTAPTTINISGYTSAVHTLPPSHLPITKYVSINRDDAIDLHRHLCSSRSSVWYADGSSRAGEAWCAAVEWKMDSGRSGSKMRGVILEGDALEAELGGLYKAAEGFKELLQQSIKDAEPISHELTVFCDSQAAIIALDTSSRPEALKFDQLWREICSEFLHAHMTLVWIPKDGNIEGQVLADRIATVAASNSYLKRRKERTLPELYSRPGSGDPAPSASSEPGPWQRGDADPSRHKAHFERPKPRPISPILQDPQSSNGLKLDLAPASDPVDGEDEGIQPREGAVFVTHFPLEASAKDIGILFAQYGEIVAVDIFHISPAHPRFANVTFSDPASGLAAIQDLHRRPIRLDTPFAQENQADLEIWKNWAGQLTVVQHEPPRIVPSSVEADFPDLPDWARGNKDARKSEEEETMEVEGQIKEEPSATPESISRKRERERKPNAATPMNGGTGASTPVSSVNSPSPRKRLRTDITTDNVATHNVSPQDTQAANAANVADLVSHAQPEVSKEDVTQSAPISQDHRSDSVDATFLSRGTPPVALPPFPPTIKTDGAGKTTPQSLPAALPDAQGRQSTQSTTHTNVSALPPTPLTAERPAGVNAPPRSPPRQPSLEAGSQSSKPAITNSASEPQEYPIKISAKTLKAHINLTRNSLVKHDLSNWIAHTCLIAHDIDHARRALQADLYATDECFITGRDLERALASRGFTAPRVDAFISKVLKVLDGIAAAEEPEADQQASDEDVERLEKELEEVLQPYPDQTKEAMSSAAKVMEYLVRGKELQEKKRLEVERRVKVLEGMVKIGEVVGGVVRYLLTEAT
ncbi:hypothetical protein CI109_103127 [Kwoniella shandongensis]|uniref:Uncharacterized protein n=1 Tax=Kwoniella shandongensis TaxID=1734106 RepID=A0A5M6C8K4_9TREE|nr:uncharacterized protein CI109_000319 [Kwoniella shandongensis]KAA5531477.1 hypothetical protein CI109_000319 [Kwoniella shandongensis]